MVCMPEEESKMVPKVKAEGGFSEVLLLRLWH